MPNYKFPKSCQIKKLNELYQTVFGEKIGTFVEVGAYDGYKYSNTWGLANCGWSGHYIEPMPAAYRNCNQYHAKNKQVKIHQLAIGDGTGRIKIRADGPLSSSDKKQIEIFKKSGWVRKGEGNWVEVSQITLDEFLTTNDVPNPFELLVVDVEGSEWSVFKNFDLEKWQPQVVIVELHDKNDRYLSKREECIKLAKYIKRYYKVIYKDNTNTVFVRK